MPKYRVTYQYYTTTTYRGTVDVEARDEWQAQYRVREGLANPDYVYDEPYGESSSEGFRVIDADLIDNQGE